MIDVSKVEPAWLNRRERSRATCAALQQRRSGEQFRATENFFLFQLVSGTDRSENISLKIGGENVIAQTL
jgi:hypothetical protein